MESRDWSSDVCSSDLAKQRSLLCPLSERGWRHPLLFAVLDLLVLLDQAKSTEEKNTRQKKSILREEFRREDRPHRICGSKSAEHAHSGGPPRAEASAARRRGVAILQGKSVVLTDCRFSVCGRRRMRRTPPAGRCSPPHGAVAGAALRVLAEERIF